LFFGGLILVLTVDIIDSFTKGIENVKELGPFWPTVMAMQMFGAAVAIRTPRDAYHKFFAVFWLLLISGWTLYSMGAISALM
jgi:hypothetical protein